jgi:uncharacterized protein YmfQ (DUF2313 family)
MFTQAEAQANMRAKQPPGFAWTRDEGSNWDNLFTPAAAEQVLFEQAAEAMLIEATPNTAVQLLPDYERVLGPDPCLGPAPATIEQRQQSVFSRWTELGGASRQHFIDLAAKLGYAITIQEFAPPRAGQIRAGFRVYDPRVIFTWRVTAPPAAANALPSLTCNLRLRSPAHTTLVIQYSGPVPITDEFGVPLTDENGNVLMYPYP